MSSLGFNEEDSYVRLTPITTKSYSSNVTIILATTSNKGIILYQASLHSSKQLLLGYLQILKRYFTLKAHTGSYAKIMKAIKLLPKLKVKDDEVKKLLLFAGV